MIDSLYARYVLTALIAIIGYTLSHNAFALPFTLTPTQGSILPTYIPRADSNSALYYLQ